MSWSVPTVQGSWSFDSTQVVGILNATPDSFSDGGKLGSQELIDSRIQAMLDEGVDAFDVGGESTRPGATPVEASQEIERVIPVIEAIREVSNLPVSIDTSKATVASAAIAAGASLVNDVSGGGDSAMAAVVANARCGWILMRNQALQGNPVDACRKQSSQHVSQALAAGVEQGMLVLDPGLGFGHPPGPDPDANMALLRGVSVYDDGLPVMIGHSRKRFVATLAGSNELAALDAKTAELSVEAHAAGAAFVRVHNVGATVRALQAL